MFRDAESQGMACRGPEKKQNLGPLPEVRRRDLGRALCSTSRVVGPLPHGETCKGQVRLALCAVLEVSAADADHRRAPFEGPGVR